LLAALASVAIVGCSPRSLALIRFSELAPRLALLPRGFDLKNDVRDNRDVDVAIAVPPDSQWFTSATGSCRLRGDIN
jgi:hypothetical protein